MLQVCRPQLFKIKFFFMSSSISVTFVKLVFSIHKLRLKCMDYAPFIFERRDTSLHLMGVALFSESTPFYAHPSFLFLVNGLCLHYSGGEKYERLINGKQRDNTIIHHEEKSKVEWMSKLHVIVHILPYGKTHMIGARRNGSQLQDRDTQTAMSCTS